MKSRLVDVTLAIWGTREFKHNVVPLYMAQMVYVEVVMGVEMDWFNIPTSSLAHNGNQTCITKFCGRMNHDPTPLMVHMELLDLNNP
jgi:hypothetical protein